MGHGNLGPTDTIALGELTSSAFAMMSDVAVVATIPLDEEAIVATGSPAIIVSSP